MEETIPRKYQELAFKLSSEDLREFMEKYDSIVRIILEEFGYVSVKDMLDDEQYEECGDLIGSLCGSDIADKVISCYSDGNVHVDFPPLPETTDECFPRPSRNYHIMSAHNTLPCSICYKAVRIVGSWVCTTPYIVGTHPSASTIVCHCCL